MVRESPQEAGPSKFSSFSFLCKQLCGFSSRPEESRADSIERDEEESFLPLLPPSWSPGGSSSASASSALPKEIFWARKNDSASSSTRRDEIAAISSFPGLFRCVVAGSCHSGFTSKGDDTRLSARMESSSRPTDARRAPPPRRVAPKSISSLLFYKL